MFPSVLSFRRIAEKLQVLLHPQTIKGGGLGSSAKPVFLWLKKVVVKWLDFSYFYRQLHRDGAGAKCICLAAHRRAGRETLTNK